MRLRLEHDIEKISTMPGGDRADWRWVIRFHLHLLVAARSRRDQDQDDCPEPLSLPDPPSRARADLVGPVTAGREARMTVLGRESGRPDSPRPLAGPAAESVSCPPNGGSRDPPEGGYAMNIGEQRRTIYIEPIEEPSPADEPAPAPLDPWPIGTPEPEPAR